MTALAAILLAVAPAPAKAKATPPGSGRVEIVYGDTTDPRFRAIRDKVKAEKGLERIASIFSRVKLPHTLTLKLTGCNGEVDAWYDAEESTITVCYEYLSYVEELRGTVPPSLVAQGLSPDEIALGPFLEVFAHEMAHAIFDIFKVPVLGREEDAADQVASYLLLGMGEKSARQAIAGIAFMYAQEAREAPPKIKDFADAHGLSAQRLYNALCMAWGKDPKTFAIIGERKLLPEDRAEGCEDEYKQVQHAFRVLIAPHLRQKRG
jgi:hypothetical protein